MSVHSQITGIAVIFLVLFSFLCGCVSSSVGDISHTNSGLAATVNNPGQPVDAFVQVTVYQVDGLSQQEYTVVMTGVKLEEWRQYRDDSCYSQTRILQTQYISYPGG